MCFLVDLARKKKIKKIIISIQFNKIGYFFKNKKNGHNSTKNIKKVIFYTTITNTFDFSSKKSRIRETPTLSTDADSRTDTNLKRLRDL